MVNNDNSAGESVNLLINKSAVADEIEVVRFNVEDGNEEQRYVR